VHNAREMRQARTALDAFGQATVAVRARDGKLVWQTPLARKLLGEWFDVQGEETPPRLLDWLAAARRARGERREASPLLAADGEKRLLGSFHDQSDDDGDGEWLVVLREEDDASAVETLMSAFGLTAREAEVLQWVIRGKTNRDIGDILGTSPRTVHKHLEHVFEKLGVETRTAAAGMAMQRLQG
jgi:DNA-binding CsgD family transcriptional regulator